MKGERKMAHLEGMWDCSYCKTKGIRGLQQTCPNCGKTRGKDTKFYLGNAPRELTEEESKKVGTKADWYCDYCDSLNSANTTTCKNCGAEKGSKDYFNMNKKEPVHTPKRIREEEYDFEPTQTHYEKPKSNNSYSESNPVVNSFPTQEKHSKKRHSVSFNFIGNHFKPILACLLILMIIASAVLICMPRIKEGPVESVRWERTITLQVYKTCHESDWSVPVGGRVTRQASEFHHNEKELDHYETKVEQYTERVQTGTETKYRDNGNGTFSSYSVPVYENVQKSRTVQVPVYRNVPVYKTKYYYDIDKWTFLKNITTEGSDFSPYWGEYTLNNTPGIGQTRVGDTTERYYVTVLVNDKAKEYSMDYDLWQTMTIGQNVKLKVQLGHAEIYTEQ